MADIPINPVTRRVEFTGNTGTGPFAFTFNVLAQADVAVYKNNTLLALTSDYTVSLNSNGTGSITLTSALIATDELVIIGDLPLSRTTDFVTAGDLLASSLNEQFDSNVVMSQQLDERFDRTIRSQPGDINKNLYLPLVDDRVSQLLSFDSSGNITTTNLSNVPDIGTVNLTVSGLASFADGSLGAPSITNIGDTNTGIYFPAADQLAFTAGGNNIFSITSTYGLMSKPLYFSDGILLTDNSATALTIKEGSNNYLTFITTNGSEKLSFGSTANPTFEVNGSFNQPLIAATTSFFSQTYSGATLAATNGSVNIESYSASKAGIVLNGSGDQITFTSPTLGFVGLVQVVGAITTNTSLNIASSTTVDGILDEDDMSSNSETKLATQQSIKAYVDAQVGTVDTLAEVLGNGNTTGGTNIVVSANDVISLDDGTNALPSLTTTGDLNTGLYFPAADEVGITTGGTQRVKVDSTGIDVTGTVTADGINSSGNFAFTAADGMQISAKESISINIDSDDNDSSRAFTVISGSSGSTESLIVASEDAGVSLYYDNASKLATTSTGVDVTGTVTATGTSVFASLDISGDIDVDGTTNLDATNIVGALDVTGAITSDGLTVDGATVLDIGDEGTLQVGPTTTVADENQTFEMRGSNGSNQLQRFQITNSGEYGTVDFKYGRAGATPTKAISIGSGIGDISFYDDQGSSQSFFWDASAERLGLGVTDPDSGIELQKSSAGINSVHFANTSSTGYGAKFIGGGNTSTQYIADFRDYSGASKLRLDGSGNLLVGKTSADDGAAAGIEAQAGGSLYIAKNATNLHLNRLSTDGDIVAFRKDGTTVGIIGTIGGDTITIGSGDTGLLMNQTNDEIIPWNTSTNAARDGFIDLGDASHRFKDLYLSGGIQFDSRSNKLDDYEQGTFDVTLSTTGGSVTLNSVYNKMSYTKIGRQVTVFGLIITSGVSSPTGAYAHIDSLPFTSANLTEGSGRSGGGIFYWDGANAHVKPWEISESSTRLSIYMDASTLTSGDDFYFSCSYQTT